MRGRRQTAQLVLYSIRKETLKHCYTCPNIAVHQKRGNTSLPAMVHISIHFERQQSSCLLYLPSSSKPEDFLGRPLMLPLYYSFTLPVTFRNKKLDSWRLRS